MTELLDLIDIGTWEWNITTGDLTVNDKWAKMVGYSLEELEPININTWRKLSHPEDLKRSDSDIFKYLKGKTKNYSCELRMMHKDGSWVDILDTGFVKKRHPDGTPSVLSGIHQNISAVKNSQRDLYKNLKQEQLIADISSAFAINNDFDNTLNESFKKLGELINASRIYYFTLHDDGLFMSNTHEWCNKNVSAQINNLKNLSVEIFPWWMSKLKKNEIIDIKTLSELPEEATSEKEILESQQVKSLIVLPVFLSQKLHGFVGFDDVTCEFKWRTNDYNLLRMLSNVISNALKKKEDRDTISANHSNLLNFFNSLNSYVIVFNDNREILSVNNSLIKKFGYNESELLGQDILMLHPEYIRKEAELILRNILAGNENNCPLPALTKNGQIVFVETNIVKGRWDEEEVYYSTINDVSELRLSEERFSKMFNLNPAITLLINNKSGHIYEANQSFLDKTGYSCSEIKEIRIQDLIKLEDAEFKDVLSKSVKLEHIKNIKTKMLKKDGDTLDLILSVSAIKIQTSNLSLIIGNDVSDFLNAERELKTLYQAVEANNAGFIVLDYSGILNYVNNAVISHGGFSKSMLEGNSVLEDKLLKEFIPDFKEIQKRVTECSSTYKKTTKRVKFNGDIFWAEEIITPVLENGKVSKIVIITQDVTEKKRIFEDLTTSKKKAEESDRIKSSFIASMNHELRTPLNHIIGYSNIIPDFTDDVNIIKLCKIINKSGHYLQNIVEDIFQLSSLESNELSIRNERHYIRDLYLDIKDLMTNILKESNKSDVIRLEYNVDREIIDKSMLIDKAKIIQIVTNLVKNSFKFTKEGIIGLNFIVTNKHDAEYLSITICDTGEGIPINKQKVIFDLFRQADESKTRRYSGIGIGLSISKRIAQAIGAELHLESQKGKGSMFKLDIPIVKP